MDNNSSKEARRMKPLIRQFPAIAISAGALLVALTGFATASPTASTAGVTPAQVRTIAKAVANERITARASTLSVASTRTAATANAPALYAQVTGAGVVTANSRGITQANVARPEPGLYCFSGLTTVPKGGLVTVDSNVTGGGSGPDLAQVGITSLRRCPAGTQAHVATFPQEYNSNGQLVDDPFFVVFWF
jgi:hypothetical protein